jgi:hypothetical protein
LGRSDQLSPSAVTVEVGRGGGLTQPKVVDWCPVLAADAHALRLRSSLLQRGFGTVSGEQAQQSGRTYYREDPPRLPISSLNCTH